MKFSRFIFPSLLTLILLFAQQIGAIHTLRHMLAQQEQQHKQLPESPACGECAAYTQIGSALHSAAPATPLLATSAVTVSFAPRAFRSIQLPAAVARGPPLQKIA